jgi:uncharacterized spore protein YtfJ
MAGNNNFKDNIEALIGGMEGYINTKSVVGEAITVGDNILLPLADVSFGLGVGTFGSAEKNNGAGGMGAKITPSAVLVVNNDSARILSLKDNPGLFEKIIEIAPGLISKFMKKDEKKEESTGEGIFE